MTESAAQEAAVSTPVKTPKSKKSATPKSAKTKSSSKKAAPSHPPTAQMVNNAIKNLKERGGSSLQAIKKYIASTYKVDAEKNAPFIKKYLKTAVDNGTLIRTKGKGASGSFKLAAAQTGGAKKTENKPKAAVKTSKPKKANTAAATPKKAKPAAKPKASKPAATPKKAKTPKKAPAAKKPKTPKPKSTTPKKAAKK